MAARVPGPPGFRSACVWPVRSPWSFGVKCPVPELSGPHTLRVPPGPVVAAVFPRTGDATYFWTEHVDTEEETIAMTWFDFGKPFVTGTPAGSSPDRPLGWTSIFVPARKVQLTLNGTAAMGRAFPEQRGDNVSSTAGLALSESWFQPR